MRSPHSWLAVTCLVPAGILSAACRNSVEPQQAIVEQGAIEIFVTTTGDSPDTDGYALFLDGLLIGRIAPTATDTIPAQPAGRYSVRLWGIATNCTAGSDSQEVKVIGGATVQVAFRVTCVAPDEEWCQPWPDCDLPWLRSGQQSNEFVESRLGRSAKGDY